MAIKYFLYSDEQIKEKNIILARSGKCFMPGTIVINGRKTKFTQISNNANIGNRFSDIKIIAVGEESTFSYIAPTTELKRG